VSEETRQKTTFLLSKILYSRERKADINAVTDRAAVSVGER